MEVGEGTNLDWMFTGGGWTLKLWFLWEAMQQLRDMLQRALCEPTIKTVASAPTTARKALLL
ncbi:unnamed protein product [Prunus armeniaca]